MNEIKQRYVEGEIDEEELESLIEEALIEEALIEEKELVSDWINVRGDDRLYIDLEDGAGNRFTIHVDGVPPGQYRLRGFFGR